MFVYDDGSPQSAGKADHFRVSSALYITSIAQGGLTLMRERGARDLH
jgi:hypothetical protein